MGTYSRIVMSGSTDGQGIPLTVTAPSTGLTIHTCVTGSDQSVDELWLYVYSTVTTSIVLNISLGPTTATGSRFTQTVTADDKKGLLLVVPGLVGRNALVWKAWVTTADLVNLYGHVNRFAS